MGRVATTDEVDKVGSEINEVPAKIGTKASFGRCRRGSVDFEKKGGALVRHEVERAKSKGKSVVGRLATRKIRLEPHGDVARGGERGARGVVVQD